MGERKFRDDFKKRMILSKYLVLEVIMYGIEIWGWREMEGLERIREEVYRMDSQSRFLRAKLYYTRCPENCPQYFGK